MFTPTNNQASSTQRELSSLTVKDYAVGILQGNEDAYSKYLSLKTFDRSKHPAWLDALCFRLAELRFEEMPFANSLGALMYTASIQHFANPVKSWVLKNVLLERPETVRGRYFKAIEEIKKIATPRFTDKHYTQIGIPEAGVLNELLEISSNTSTPQHSGNLLDQMRQLALSSKLDERKIDEFLSSVITFDPKCNNQFGVAAGKAYFDIGEAIIRYAVLSDVLEHFDISLSERKLRELYCRVVDLPFDQWEQDPAFQALYMYSHALSSDPTLSENISRRDVFSRFAMTGRPLTDLISEAHRVAANKIVSKGSIQERTEFLDEDETASVLDQMLHSVENLFREWEIEASTEELAPLRLARLAVSHGVPFSKLERFLILHDFDGKKVIDEYINILYIEYKTRANSTIRKHKLDSNPYIKHFMKPTPIEDMKIVLADYEITKENHKFTDHELCYYVNDFRTPETKVDESQNFLIFKISETIKFKLSSPQLLRTIELFATKPNDFFNTVARFHLPCVRAYYQHDNVYILPSCITSMMTGLNIDYKYFAGTKNPIDILNKYLMRGFGTLLNTHEKKHMTYYNTNIKTLNGLFYVSEKSKQIRATKLFGPRELTNNIYKPLCFLSGAPETTYNPIPTTYIKTLDDLKQHYKHCASPENSGLDMFKMYPITSEGNIAPLQAWLSEAYWNMCNSI